MGNLDPVGIFKDANAATVYATTTSLLARTANFPNFVLSTGCDVPSGVPLENIDAFFNACTDYNNRF
jgi:uroporphyrinogen decarboxylase